MSRKYKGSRDLITESSLAKVSLYGSLLLFYISVSIIHRYTIGVGLKDDPKYEKLKAIKDFKLFFFTGWNFVLQILFLVSALADEVLKFASKFQALQKNIAVFRNYLFSALVFPCSLLVVTVFWSIWHINREWIFPKLLDDFYPVWLNHTMHTFILVPLVIEVIVQRNNWRFNVSNKIAAIILVFYATVYKVLYMSIYWNHGVWLYPVYYVLTWPQRALFILAQIGACLIYQKAGLFMITRGKIEEKSL